jgi:hypothetical protein
VKLHVSALRFFFVKTLKRTYLLDDIPYPKVPRRLGALHDPRALLERQPFLGHEYGGDQARWIPTHRR